MDLFAHALVDMSSFEISLHDRSIGTLWNMKIYPGHTKMGEEIMCEQKCSLCVGNPYLCDERVFWKTLKQIGLEHERIL